MSVMNETLPTASRGEESRKMLGYQLEGPATTATLQYLGLEDFERAGVRLAERRYGARDTIFAPGDPDGQLYFLLEGTVRLYKIYGDYKEATVALLKDGGVFGQLTLNEVIKRRPEVAMKLFFSFAERLRQSDEVIESLLDRGVSARLTTLLLNL